MTDSRHQRPHDQDRESAGAGTPAGGNAGPEDDVPRDTALEVGEADEDATPESGIGRSAAARRLRAGAAGAARGSAASVARSSAAVAQTGVALAERGSRVTYWPAQLCVLGAILLQVRLPEKLTVGPSWLLPSLEAALLIGLAATTPRGRVDDDHPVRRHVAIALIALVNVANAASLYLLAHELLHKHVSNGRSLILSGITIWLTNVLIFALWYWQLDRGGPANRVRHPDPTTRQGRPDFVFTPMDCGLP